MENGKGLSIAALILGIVSIIFCFINPIVALICGIVGLILGVMARKRQPNGMATAGFILSIIGLVISIIMFIAVAACIGTALVGLGALGAAF